MTLRLSPDTLASGYEYLRTTPPLKGWKLPHADEVAFHVVSDPRIFADIGFDDDGGPLIRVSAKKNKTSVTLLMSIAHEAIHLHQYLCKLDRGGEHNDDFRKRARLVCRAHGWDEELF